MKITIWIITCAVGALFLGGCSTGPSRVETDYGTSYKLAIANQTLDPDAGKNMEPVTGLDGPAAQKAYNQYLKAFEKPEKRSVYQLGVIGEASK